MTVLFQMYSLFSQLTRKQKKRRRGTRPDEAQRGHCGGPAHSSRAGSPTFQWTGRRPSHSRWLKGIHSERQWAPSVLQGRRCWPGQAASTSPHDTLSVLLFIVRAETQPFWNVKVIICRFLLTGNTHCLRGRLLSYPAVTSRICHGVIAPRNFGYSFENQNCEGFQIYLWG